MDGLSPAFLLGLHPGVKSGLWFFDQGYVVEAGGLGCLDGQLASDGIKGGRHGQVDILGFTARLRVVRGLLVIPGITKVSQEGCRGFNR